MKRTILCKSVPAVLFLVLLLVGNLPVFSQQTNKTPKPLVILTALASPPGDTVAGTLASTMTSSIELMLKLTGRVTLRRADFLIPTTSLERTIPYYDEHKAAEAVFGSVTATGNGEYAIDLAVWNASNPNGKPTLLKRTISNVLSSFDLADEMSLKVASTIVGKKLEEGTLVVQNVSSLPKFSVYANGHVLGRNRTSFHILTGNWKIVIAKPGEVGDVAVQTFHVDVRQGKTATVALSQAPPRHAVVANNAKAVQSAHPIVSKSTGSSVDKSTPTLTVSPTTGAVSVTTATAGSLYLDGREMGHIPAGRSTLSSVGVGIRKLVMHYTGGHVEQKEVTVRAGSATNAKFGYRTVFPGSGWTDRTLPTRKYWSSVTYGKGTFVAIAAYGNDVAISGDGSDWIESSLPSRQNWHSVTYGNGTFLAVATGSDVVATSSDGISWIQHTLPSSEDWQSVTYGNGTFLAVAAGSDVVATSNDGTEWTERSLPSRENWSSVTYGNGVFLAVASNTNVVATSSDGVNWTEGSLPSREDWSSVTYGNGTFVAIGIGLYGNDVGAASTDGVNWTEGPLPSHATWSSMTYGNGTFVAVTIGSNVVITSNDGLNWTEHTMPSSQDYKWVTYGNGSFVAVVWNSNVVATSP